MFRKIYLDIIVGMYTAVISIIMLIVSMEQPGAAIELLEHSNYDFVFTFRGRYMMDLVASLFLFAMGWYGVVASALTCGLIFGIRLVGVRHPDSFNELFRPPNDEEDLGTQTTDGRSVLSEGTEYTEDRSRI